MGAEGEEMNTMVELVQELEKLSPSEGKNKMVQLAKDGMFHDYRSKAVCGKMYFVECAQWCKRNMVESDCKIIDKLEKQIKNGDYDEPYTKEDADIVLAEVENDPTISEKDREFFKKQMQFKG